MEGGTEGLGPSEGSVASAVEAEAVTWSGPGSAGHRGEGSEVQWSREPPLLCRTVTPRPAVRPVAVPQAVGGGAVAAARRLGAGRLSARRREIGEFEEDREPLLPSCPRTRAPCPGPSTGTIMSCRR